MKESTTASISPAGSKQMDFPEALRKVIVGDKIRREEWPAGEIGFMNDGFLMIEKNGLHRWIISDGDLLATDWVIAS